MEYTVTLGIYKDAQMDNTGMVVPDTLTLHLESPYRLDDLRATVRNGETVKKFKVEQSTLCLDEMVFPGVIEAEFKLIARGEVVKRWEMPPILVKDTDDHFELADYLHSLAERIAVLEEKTNVIM